MRLIVFLVAMAGVAAAQTVDIGPVTFSGTGLNDAAAGGTYVGVAENHQYTATICAAGTPDTVMYARDSGLPTSCGVIASGPNQLSYPAGTISAATWSGGRVTYTTAAPHGLSAGTVVTVIGAAPGGYNVSTVAVRLIGPMQFSVALSTNPGTYTGGGAATGADGVTITWAAKTGHTVSSSWSVAVTAKGNLAPSTVLQVGAGTIVRSPEAKARDIVSVLDYATCNGVTDDTAGLRAAIAALKRVPQIGTGAGGALYFPASATCMVLNSDLLVQGFFGLEIYGAGYQSTLTLVNAGLHLNGVLRGHIHDLRIVPRSSIRTGTLAVVSGSAAVVGTGTAFTSGMVSSFITAGGQSYQVATYTDATHITLTLPFRSASGSYSWGLPDPYAIRLTSSNISGVATNRALHIDHVWIECDGGNCQDGILSDADGGAHPDNNNDFHLFQDLQISGFAHAGVWLKGSQGYSHFFLHDDVNGFGYGQFAVMATAYGATVASEGIGLPGVGGFCSSFSTLSGSFAGSLSDFFIDGNSGQFPVSITQDDAETTNYFIYAPNAVARQIEVHGGRWVRQDNRAGATPVTSRTDFIYVQGGSLKLDGGSYSDSSAIHKEGLTLNYRAANGNMMQTLELDNVFFNTIYQTLGNFLTGDAPNATSPHLVNASFASDQLGSVTLGFLALEWLNTGTVTATNGSSGVVGSGTAFKSSGLGSGINPQASIVIQGVAYDVYQIVDDTHLTLGRGSAFNYAGKGGSALSYTLAYGGMPDYSPGIYAANAKVVNLTATNLTVLSPTSLGTGFSGTKTRTVCATIAGGVPTGCSNVTETYINGRLQ